jgi:hypothetical protein
MKAWRVALLIFELALFAVILIHPMVDLPAFAFHGGTAPVAVRARLSSAPMTAIVVCAAGQDYPCDFPTAAADSVDRTVPLTLNTRLSLECALLC